MPEYLRKPGDRYHVRVAVPDDLFHLFPRREILRNLGQLSALQARAAATQLAGRFANEIATLRIRAALGADDGELIQLAERAYTKMFPAAHRRRIDRAVGRTATSRRLRLNDAIARFMEDRRQRLTAKSELMQRAGLDLFVTIIGKKLLDQVSREDCRHFRDTLAKLPSNMSMRFPGKTLEQVIALASPPMASKNANRIISALSSLMNWCVREGLIAASPAKGLLIPINVRADQEREVFDRSDLTAIFSRLSPEQGSRFWILLIGYYTGMRLDETCQRTVDDVIDVVGVSVFWVNARNGKRLKTARSTSRPKTIQDIANNFGCIIK